MRRTARLLPREPGDAYLHAIENLVLHEVGHTLGLPHCPLDRCIMADAKGNALHSAEVSINEFCPRCYEAIRKHLRAPIGNRPKQKSPIVLNS